MEVVPSFCVSCATDGMAGVRAPRTFSVVNVIKCTCEAVAPMYIAVSVTARTNEDSVRLFGVAPVAVPMNETTVLSCFAQSAISTTNMARMCLISVMFARNDIEDGVPL